MARRKKAKLKGKPTDSFEAQDKAIRGRIKDLEVGR